MRPLNFPFVATGAKSEVFFVNGDAFEIPAAGITLYRIGSSLQTPYTGLFILFVSFICHFTNEQEDRQRRKSEPHSHHQCLTAGLYL